MRREEVRLIREIRGGERGKAGEIREGELGKVWGMRVNYGGEKEEVSVSEGEGE